MLKKLKSLFIIEEEENGTVSSESKNNSKTEKESPSNSTKEAVLPSKDEASDLASSGQAEEKFVNRLLTALEENNLDGFDYLEYKQALQNLSSVNMDEATRYKSALAMATTMGATTPVLIESAQHYLKVLKDEEVKFLQAFENQQSRLVQSQKNELVQLQKAIETKEQQIAQLTKEVEAHKASLNGKQKEADQATAKVQATKQNFYASYNIVVDQIDDDINKMTDYLQ